MPQRYATERGSTVPALDRPRLRSTCQRLANLDPTAMEPDQKPAGPDSSPADAQGADYREAA